MKDNRMLRKIQRSFPTRVKVALSRFLIDMPLTDAKEAVVFRAEQAMHRAEQRMSNRSSYVTLGQ